MDIYSDTWSCMKNKKELKRGNEAVWLTDDQNQGLWLKDTKSTGEITFGWRRCIVDMNNKML